MRSRRTAVKLQPAGPPTLRAPSLVVGVDGGGTKTRAVVAAAGGREILGEGRAGPSNPLRVGVSEAAAAVREAVERACAAAGVRRSELAAAEVGLAGVKREDLRAAMRAALSDLGVEPLEVVTDAEIALYGVAGERAGLVIIAGSGSICRGRNARGRQAWAGGWGPVAGDEGSGSWMARRALQAVAKATDGRGPRTSLVEAACDYFNVAAAEDLATAVYAPSITNQRIAGFGRVVIEAAKRRDAVSREIVEAAGRELAQAAGAVVRRLRMQRERFAVGYVGGVFAAGELILEPLREGLAGVAPRAYLAPPALAPAEAAALMAGEHLRLALAG
ncbi:MAG TPA: BadF/BadG/BcrA/BcrD ATPase family protein [Pyrinomonadaceae bacterium]|nr:BadF/BadG/BcrA/BcrD ATPase family protein [Pyrinomonadaceae bacterium]